MLIDKRHAATWLLAYYDANARSLPWRSPPGCSPPEPYIVWLSEVMLQQTTVATVKPRFRRFIDRWPTVEALAAADDEAVLSEWAGLGYYARARNLIACAREVVRRGGFPRTESGLRALPGIGEYTAAAIAAIAFGERATVIDTNVARVIARYHGIERPLQQAHGEIRTLAERHDSGRPSRRLCAGDDGFGRHHLPPETARLPRLPAAPGCSAWASGAPEQFPSPRIKPARPHRHGLAWWIERNGAVWLVRRPAKGMLGGMAALPGPDWSDDPPQAPVATTIRHGFTHFTLDLHVAAKADPQGEGWWQPLDRLPEAGLPTLYAKAAQAMLTRKAKLPRKDTLAA